MTDSQISAPQSLPSCRYAAVLFDLDGTLLDTAPDFVTAINQLDPGNSPSVPAYSVQPPQYLPSFNVYSNSSYGLLGQSLAYIDFPTEAFSPGVLNALFCRYILNPLNMTRTNVCAPSVTLNGQCTSFNQICSAQADWSNTMELLFLPTPAQMPMEF